MTRGTFTTASADNGTFVSDGGMDVRYDVSLSGDGPERIGGQVSPPAGRARAEGGRGAI